MAEEDIKTQINVKGKLLYTELPKNKMEDPNYELR
jgi:hypothetical protein